jgi:hypothetical protein
MQSQKKSQQQEDISTLSLLPSPLGSPSPRLHLSPDTSPYLADERRAFVSASPLTQTPSLPNITRNSSLQINSDCKFFSPTPVQARSLKISRVIECVLEHNEEFPEGKLAFKGAFLEIVKITNILNLLGHHYRPVNEKNHFSFTTKGYVAMQLVDDISLIKENLETLKGYIEDCMDLQLGSFFLNLFDNKAKMIFHFNKNKLSLSLEGDQQIVDLFQVLIPANRMIASVQTDGSKLIYGDADKLVKQIDDLLIDIENIIVKPIRKAYEGLSDSMNEPLSP